MILSPNNQILTILIEYKNNELGRLLQSTTLHYVEILT